MQKLVFDLLETGKDERLLAHLFGFFEEMANSSDPNVSRDLLGIAILEPLVYEKAKIRAAWKFMGPKMKELAEAKAKPEGGTRICRPRSHRSKYWEELLR